MTLTFDQDAYRNLLVQVAPKVIETEAEYDRALAEAERLTFAKHRTPEEKVRSLLTSSLISCHAFKLGISSEQDAKPAAWLRLTHYKAFAVIDIKV
ncbi:MAG: hypothetical protein RIB93_14870 [Coleofasciculus sp. D1-CHI-01]|uniref:hypothetical protein n=1 Tax=Coleofasciculus sp. D1-CHI-01 TaxID=3068482 RepID=UPI0032FD8A41